ncbi:MAG: hypothetical protein LC649_03875 [Bacteroidales bacterium]|nr:hypothetical protein [Bacteroidales bacterium]
MAGSANRRLTIAKLLLLAIVLALTLVIIIIVRNRETGTARLVVENPEIIDYVRISGDKEEVILTRPDERIWLVNGEDVARPSAVNMLLRTLAILEVKSPVSDEFFHQATGNGAVLPVSVEVKGNGRMLADFTVYLLSGNSDGNIFQKERGGDYFIAHLPGYDINPAIQFISGSRYWRPFTIFEINPSGIISVEVTRRLPEEESFLIESAGGRFRLTLNGVAQEVFDTAAVEQYIAWYAFVPFERWSTELDDSRVGSILAEDPVLTIRVTEQVAGLQDGTEQQNGGQNNTEQYKGDQNIPGQFEGSQGVREHFVRFWRIISSDGTVDNDRLLGEKDRSGELFIVTYFDIDPVIIRGDKFISE